MLDSVLIANEMVDFLKKEKLWGVIVKVDYEKGLSFCGLGFFDIRDGQNRVQ